ncbi:hypothetical protein BY996DRAFT_6427009 [Phakopsora pachyrhizi]|nr:hypothetical protein BY996DRAFT_6427009 [Phakopsora pachyrhizi]
MKLLWIVVAKFFLCNFAFASLTFQKCDTEIRINRQGLFQATTAPLKDLTKPLGNGEEYIASMCNALTSNDCGADEKAKEECLNQTKKIGGLLGQDFVKKWNNFGKRKRCSSLDVQIDGKNIKPREAKLERAVGKITDKDNLTQFLEKFCDQVGKVCRKDKQFQDKCKEGIAQAEKGGAEFNTKINVFNDFLFS